MQLDQVLATQPDVISHVLAAMRLRGTFYCHSHLTAPWGLTMPAVEQGSWFHLVLHGACVLAPEETPHVMGPGDFALLPHGRGHTIKRII